MLAQLVKTSVNISRPLTANSHTGSNLGALDGKIGALGSKIGALSSKIGALDRNIGALGSKIGAA